MRIRTSPLHKKRKITFPVSSTGVIAVNFRTSFHCNSFVKPFLVLKQLQFRKVSYLYLGFTSLLGVYLGYTFTSFNLYPIEIIR